MKQVCPVDWDTVRKKFQIESFGVDSETLSKMARLGFWGKALTTDPLSLSSAMAVWGAPFRTDVFLSASSEADAEALLSALEKGREYFFSFNSKYPWRKVIERKLSGGYVGRKLRCKVSKKKFNPQVIYEVIKLDEEHKDIVKSYPDDDMARKHILSILWIWVFHVLVLSLRGSWFRFAARRRSGGTKSSGFTRWKLSGTKGMGKV